MAGSAWTEAMRSPLPPVLKASVKQHKCVLCSHVQHKLNVEHPTLCPSQQLGALCSL